MFDLTCMQQQICVILAHGDKQFSVWSLNRTHLSTKAAKPVSWTPGFSRKELVRQQRLVTSLRTVYLENVISLNICISLYLSKVLGRWAKGWEWLAWNSSFVLVTVKLLHFKYSQMSYWASYWLSLTGWANPQQFSDETESVRSDWTPDGCGVIPRELDFHGYCHKCGLCRPCVSNTNSSKLQTGNFCIKAQGQTSCCLPLFLAALKNSEVNGDQLRKSARTGFFSCDCSS